MSKLIKKITLICADDGSADGIQHNKCWHGELYDDNLVVTRWGRVGYDLQSKEFLGAGESFLLKKEVEKIKKGYTKARIVDTVVVVPTTVPLALTNLHEIAKTQIITSVSKNPILDKLIERLVRSNVHKITSNTNIVLNDSTGLFQTPLGIVTPDAIVEARNILASAIPFVNRGKYNGDLSKLVISYLRLIPQNIGMKFNVQNILPDVNAIQKQNDILDALEASYQAITNRKPSNSKSKVEPEQVFKVDLDIDNGNDADRLVKWFETSKKRAHGYDNVKVKNIFKVKIHDMFQNFDPKNVKEVFHGTSEANNLSILKSGLRVSPPASAAIAGKMFGNGVYGAVNSTKSLGYTFGRWGQSKGESGWLYICQFSMGNIYYPRGYGQSSSFKPPTGHDSVWATATNTGLNHDELIVYKNSSVNITHLLECK